MHLGAIGATKVIDQLVQIVGESVFRVRALMQLHQNVTAHREEGIRRIAAEVHRDVVLPLDFVPEVVLVPRGEGIVDIELLVRIAKRDIPHLAIERRASGVPAVVVTERTPRHRIDWWVPGRIAFMVGADDRVGVVLGLRAVVASTRGPDAERRGVTGGRPVVGSRRPVVAGGDHEHEHQERAVHDLSLATESPHSPDSSGDRCHSQMGHGN